MLSRRRLYILIPAIILIPILLGMTPLTMAHRLASGGALPHGKQLCWNNYCPFHSLISHDDPTIVSLVSAPLYQNLPSSQEMHIPVLDPIHSDSSSNSVPLRC
jgi:hypothetical protein